MIPIAIFTWTSIINLFFIFWFYVLVRPNAVNRLLKAYVFLNLVVSLSQTYTAINLTCKLVSDNRTKSQCVYSWGYSCWMGMERIEKFDLNRATTGMENEEESYRWGRSSPAHHRQLVPCRVSESKIYTWGCSQDTNFILWFRCFKNLGGLQTMA